MKMNEILSAIRLLAGSQGFYGRLLNSILWIKDNEPEKYEKLKQELESQNFGDMVDMVLYFEE